jgi:cytochrome oxidase Cu insertion factor (SCO1/SenC/PrrC family)
MIDSAPANKFPRRTFLWLSLAFFAPLLAAFVLYYGVGWHPGRMNNKGELISPVVSLPDVALHKPDGSMLDARWLQGKWTLVYVADGACDQSCRDALLVTRSIRLLLGKDSVRVQRALLFAGSCDQPYFAAEHPDLVLARIDDGVGQALLKLFSQGSGQNGGDALQARRIYIIDPLGNLMMRYQPGADARDLHSDIKNLLSLSHIG